MSNASLRDTVFPINPDIAEEYCGAHDLALDKFGRCPICDYCEHCTQLTHTEACLPIARTKEDAS